MTTREAILNALVAMLADIPGFPSPTLDEPEPTRWAEIVGGSGPVQIHAVGVQDDTPETLAFVRGADIDEAGEEIEFTPVIAYAVQAKPQPGMRESVLRLARRAQRDAAVRVIADLIAADRSLGLGHEVCAIVQPPARDDGVSFTGALPSATALIPVRVLYTGRDAAS